MNNKSFWRFYLFALAAVVAASFYPIYMAIRVAGEILQNGTVPIESYPKYIIPYTPISIAVILGVALMPVFRKLSRKWDFFWGTVFSVVIFFIAERLMETKILVQTTKLVPLESWQMSLCMVPPEEYETRTWQAVDVLLGGYSPAFKLHFYMISIVIILSLLNCFYGFAKMIASGDHTRKTALSIQTVTSLSFLGMCIWACFTSFYRRGELTVPAISAVLMSVFFALLGVTVGIFTSSFTLRRSSKLSILLPAVLSAAATFLMYIGEMILLQGHLYRFGSGFLFKGLGAIVLAPVDLLVILISGCATAMICKLINRQSAA